MSGREVGRLLVYAAVIFAISPILASMLARGWFVGAPAHAVMQELQVLVLLPRGPAGTAALSALLLGVYASALVLYTVDFRRRVQGLLLAAGSAIGVVILAGAGLLIPSIAASQLNVVALGFGAAVPVFLERGSLAVADPRRSLRGYLRRRSGRPIALDRAQGVLFGLLVAIVGVGLVNGYLTATASLFDVVAAVVFVVVLRSFLETTPQTSFQLVGVLAGGRYFDSAALILLFITLGNYLEARSKSEAGAAISELLQLQPAEATRLATDGTEETVPVDALAVGDRIRIRPGEQVPIDARVLDGESAIDEAIITGESVPVTRGPGDALVGGTLNTSGSLVATVTETGADTTLARIVETVRDAQSRQPAIQRIADRISAYFVPIVIVNALAWAALWWAAPAVVGGLSTWLPLWPPVGGGPTAIGGAVSSMEFAVIVFASAVLIACPCALGLATPAATMVGTALGARHGVFFTGGDVLEQTATIDTVVFDKTGTLTTGDIEVTEVVTVDAVAQADGGVLASAPADLEARVLAYAAAAERPSEHPLGRAIVDRAPGADSADRSVSAFEAHAGRGVSAVVDGTPVLVGNRRLLDDHDVDIEPLAPTVEALESAGNTVMIVAIDGALAGVIAAADTIKPTAAAAVAALRDRDIAVHMITGDNARTAAGVAEQVGIAPEAVDAGVLPEEKAARVEAMVDAGERVMMVGDGVNDAPALAAATVGTALGSGTDVAIEAADITLMRDDPDDVIRAIRVGEATMRKIRQNLFWALGYNTAMIPLASLGLLQPVLAAVAMAFSSVSVLANSLVFRGYDPDRRYRLLGWLR
ncbi:MAG: heavy metal translocating P-type ATPase [Haloferacaceae archaeon]|nr:heavy metal translocating P-type ATPase [Haloferacaceae archaeon]